MLIGNAVRQTTGPSGTREEHAVVATTLTLLVGLFTFALGLARLGFVDSVMSRALLRGFITAVACVILIEQLPVLLGLSSSLYGGDNGGNGGGGEQSDGSAEESTFMKFLMVIEHLGSANGASTLISALAVSFLFGFARLKRYLAWNLDHPSALPYPRRTSHHGGGSSGSTPLVHSRTISPVSTELAPDSAQKLESFDDIRRNADARRRSTSGDHRGKEESNQRKLSMGSLADAETSLLHPTTTTTTTTTTATATATASRASRSNMHIRLIFFIPEILIVVVFSIVFSYALRLHSNYGVEILGEDAMKGGFRKPLLPKLSMLSSLITPAVLISILGFVESIVVVKTYGAKYNYPVSANRELVAFGTVNLIGSLVNCYPAFSSMARSQVNDATGARTQLAGFITGFIILLTILFFLPVFYWLPKCVMASIVLVAASGLLEFEDMVFMWKIRAWKDIGMMLLTFSITIFWSVEAGVLISIALSLVLVWCFGGVGCDCGNHPPSICM